MYDAVLGSGGLAFVALFSLMGIPVLPAIGTMRLLTLLQEGVSVCAFRRKNLLHILPMLWYGMWSAAGGLIGAKLLIGFDPTYLAQIVGGFMLLLLFVIPYIDLQDRAELTNPLTAPFMLLRQYIRKSHPKTLHFSLNIKTALLTAACFLLSIYGGFYGAGFGTLALFPFVLIGGIGILRGAAYARVIGFCMSLTASILFLQEEMIDWHLFAPLAMGTAIGAWIGVELATRMNLKWLRILLFAVVLLGASRLLFFG